MRTEQLFKVIKRLVYRTKIRETMVTRFYTIKGRKHHPTQAAEQYHALASGNCNRTWWLDGKQHCTTGPAGETDERCWLVQNRILLFAERRI